MRVLKSPLELVDPKTRGWLSGLVVAAVGSAALAIATSTSPFATIDSASFVEQANTLASKGSLVGTLAPATHFPPGYPVLLSLGPRSGREALPFARLLNLGLFFGTLVVVTWLVAHATGSPLAVWVGGIWAATSVELLHTFGAVLSEAPYIFAVTAWIALLSRYLETRRTPLLFLAATAAASAALIRYVGIACILAAMPVLLVQRPNARRWKAALFHSTFAAVPLLVWLLRNQFLTGEPTNRPLELHPPDWAQIGDALEALSRWLLPNRIAPAVRVPSFLLALGLTVWVALRTTGTRRRNAADPGAPLAMVCVCYIAAHFAVVLGTMTFADADLGRGSGAFARLLVPAFLPALVWTVLVWVRWRASHARPRTLVLAAGLGLGVLLVVHLVQGAYNIARLARDGEGVLSPQWDRSAVTAFVRGLPENALVYTNGPSAVYLLTGRLVHELPRKELLATAEAAPDYSDGVEEMTRELRRRGGVVVLWDAMSFAYYPSLSELRALLPLRPEISEALGSVHRVAASDPARTPGWPMNAPERPLHTCTGPCAGSTSKPSEPNDTISVHALAAANRHRSTQFKWRTP